MENRSGISGADVRQYHCHAFPGRIALGGGVMHQRQLFPMVRCRTLELLGGYVAAPEIVEHMDSYIVAPGLGDNAGAVGSLMLARRALQ